jgi:phospholipid/cholesterol/gamma-HCH transport system substrate-binding protein
MKRETSNNIRLGLFVIAALVAFTVAVYYIGSRQNLFGATIRVSSYFQNVKGLQTGNNVRYAGIDVGSVVAIDIVDDSTLRVDMLLEKRVQPYLRTDAQAQIGSDGLVGNMVINITPGSSEMPALAPGAVLPSYEPIATQEMLNTLGTTNENIALLSAYLLETVQNINKGRGTLAMLLRDSMVAEDLRASMIALRQTATSLSALSNDLRRTVADVSAGEGSLGYLLRDTSLAYQVDQLGLQVNDLIATEVAPALSDLHQTSTEMAEISAGLNDLVAQFDSSQGLAATVLRDTAVAQDLRETMESVNEGAARFNENMEALQHNFLLRGFFKKQERQAKKAARQAAREKAELNP